MSKEMVSAKLSPVTKERLEDYADRMGISRSEAVDRMVTQGLDVEESDMRLVKVQNDGGTPIENVENTVGKIQSDVDDLNGEIEKVENGFEAQSVYLRNLLSLLAFGMVWIGIEITVGLPSYLVLTTGPMLMIGLVHQLLSYWGIL